MLAISCCYSCARGSPVAPAYLGSTPNSLQLQHDCAFQDSWSGHTSFAGILGDPLPCYPSALVGTSLVLVDRDREPTASGAHEGIAHETLYSPDETFHFSFVFLQEVEKRLRPFARIVSHHSMHDTPPTADVHPETAQKPIPRYPRTEGKKNPAVRRRGEVWKLPRGHVGTRRCPRTPKLSPLAQTSL